MTFVRFTIPYMKFKSIVYNFQINFYDVYGWKFVQNFGWYLCEKFSAEKKFCRIDPRNERFPTFLQEKNWYKVYSPNDVSPNEIS
jgi:hypothetical protein